jgi:hypothetical protein
LVAVLALFAYTSAAADQTGIDNPDPRTSLGMEDSSAGAGTMRRRPIRIGARHLVRRRE